MKCIFKNKYLKHLDKFEIQAYDSTTGLPVNMEDCEDCPDYQTECRESLAYSYGIDNTGTTYDWPNAKYELTLSDGSVIPFFQTTASNGGWTAQLTELSNSLQAGFDAAGVIAFAEPRTVNNLIPSDISGNYGNNPTGLPGAPSVAIAEALISEGMAARYINIQICPGQPVPVSAEVVSHADSPRFGGAYDNGGRVGFKLTTAGAILGPRNRFKVCQECAEGSDVWYIEDGSNNWRAATSGEIPDCYEPCGTLSLTEAPPDRSCSFVWDLGCDNLDQTDPNNFIQQISRRATVCDGEQIGLDYFTEDPLDTSSLIPYGLVGAFVDCDSGVEIVPPEPVVSCTDLEETVVCIDNGDGTFTSGVKITCIDSEGTPKTTYEDSEGNLIKPNQFTYGECAPLDCGAFTGNCMCYGSGGVSDSDYVYELDANDATEGTFSMNTSTIKWETSGTLTPSITYIDECITNGGEATITTTDQDGNVVIFVASGFLNPVGTAPNTAYSGTSSGSFSGKIRKVTISCYTNENGGSGKACQWISCDKTVEKWFDGISELGQGDVDTLTECVIPVAVEPECEVSLIQVQACAAEDVAGVITGDLILTVAQRDCNNVILSSTQYNITQGNSELTEAVTTTDCDPQPDVTQTEECILDAKGVKWTEITVVQGTNITVIFVNQDTLQLGTPEGVPSEWGSCNENYTPTYSAYKDCWQEDVDPTNVKYIYTVLETSVYPPIIEGYLDEDRVTIVSTTGWTKTNNCACGC